MIFNRRCNCGANFIVEWVQSVGRGKASGFRIVCPACKKSTDYWTRLYDAELDWRQRVNVSKL